MSVSPKGSLEICVGETEELEDCDGEIGERVCAEEEENVIVKKIGDPRLPSQEEVDRHWISGHLPYRNWCPICIAAKGKDSDHVRDSGKIRNLPEYSFDYCFPGDELGFKWTVLVGKERGTKSYMATTVPMKGGIGKFATDKCLEFIEENGDKVRDIIVKTDQEPSIEYLIKDLVGDRIQGKTLVEEAPKRSNGSNGVVERGVQEVEGQIRTLFLGLQSRLGRKLDARERIVAFIPEYAAYLLNRMLRGNDGKVPYERIKGKKPSVLGIEFGEKVMFKVYLGSKLAKIEARWNYGIFVGIRRKSNEILVATSDGIKEVRSIRKIPVEKRWSEDCSLD